MTLPGERCDRKRAAADEPDIRNSKNAALIRGPRNALQAQISAHVSSASFASFGSFDVPTKEQQQEDIRGADADKAGEVVPKSAADDEKNRDHTGLAVAVEAPEARARIGVQGPPESKEDDEENAETGINRTATVRKYLEKMRGSGSKEISGAKKDKKEKKEKPKATAIGPEEPKKLAKEKKRKEKERKKLEKARKKEEKRERAMIAADRETRRIFGRDALVISSSSSEGEVSRESI
mmetsp:Transcript_91307/g.142548  ORF Transcript_91307/g.142548 Transcript_91307/m.142548 type:complete len:237 (-) Transcript_91307:15-725(-)